MFWYRRGVKEINKNTGSDGWGGGVISGGLGERHDVGLKRGNVNTVEL